MERPALERLLGEAAERLDVVLQGPRVFGWHDKSIGSRIVDSGGKIYWIRLLAWGKDRTNDRIWTGFESSARLRGVKKPLWVRATEWDENALRIRADILEFLEDKPISMTPELRSDVNLPIGWFSKLRSSLEALQEVSTDRIAVRQDLITRRLRERFGDRVDAHIDEWAVSHGDLHWANVTWQHCYLLDWEAWGLAPKGFDVALLYAFTLQSERTLRAVQQTFGDWLNSPSGEKAQMFACAELMRMTELYSDHSRLYEPLTLLATALAEKNGLRLLKAK